METPPDIESGGDYEESLHWNIEEVEDRRKLITKDEEGRAILRPLTQSVLISSVEVGISVLSEENIEEFHYRLDCLYDAGMAFLGVDTPEGPVPARIHRSDLVTHLGMKTNARLQTPTEFDRKVRDLRLTRMKGEDPL